MELENLKETWQSVKPMIKSPISDDDTARIISKKDDIKSRLLKKVIFDGTVTAFFIVLMALSPLWSPMKFPVWWLVVFCVTMLTADLYDIKVYRSLKAINLWEDTNQKILKTVVAIKRSYRNTELAISAVVIPLMIWLSLTPPFVGSWRMFFVWGLTILGFTLEYLWYRSCIKQLNNLN